MESFYLAYISFNFLNSNIHDRITGIIIELDINSNITVLSVVILTSGEILLYVTRHIIDSITEILKNITVTLLSDKLYTHIFILLYEL